jgi:rubrerythrin
MKLARLTILSAVLLLMAATHGAEAQTAGTSNIVKPALNVAANATINNLQVAFQGEKNTQARYEEYAKRADEEGYHQVASMFRAVARAEEIHASNFANVLRNEGATALDDVKTPEVGTTRENLEAAVRDEDLDRDAVYPKFADQAHKDRNRDAETVFKHTKLAEASHAVLYRQALKDLEAFRGGSERFYVCPNCGRACVTTASGKCPVCGTSREQFLTVQ